MSKPTVFDLRCVPCGCDHEKVGRNRSAISTDVIRAVEGCAFAMNGIMIGCAHVHSGAKFFDNDGREILALAMKEAGVADPELDTFYTLKGYLDVLKRRACGRCFPMDATVSEMRQSKMFTLFIHTNHPMREVWSQVFHYAENPPQDPEEIRLCDLFFLNADRFISDSINLILVNFQEKMRPRTVLN